VRRFVLIAAIAWTVITAGWWLLALWPVADAPAWLERTRYVCFGISDTGLPDAGGWIGLIAGPLGMLAILLLGWRRAVSRTAIAVVAVAIVLIATGATYRVSLSSPPAAAEAAPASTYPRLDQPAPALALVAQDGKTHSLEEFRGRPLLVTFAFAHCVTVCPLVVSQTLSAQRLLQKEGIAPVVLVVTLDPWRDTPSRLPAMAKDWQLPPTDAYVLSGSIADVEATLDGWNIPRQRADSTGDVTHPALIYIVDRNLRIAYAATGGVETIVALTRKLDS
jgi:protein SCO1/2